MSILTCDHFNRRCPHCSAFVPVTMELNPVATPRYPTLRPETQQHPLRCLVCHGALVTVTTTAGIEPEQIKD